MKNLHFYTIVACCLLLGLSLKAQEITITVNKRYLNIPVSNQAKRAVMKFETGGKPERQFDINLANQTADYWVFCDMSRLMGKTVKISFPENQAGLDMIYQADRIAGQDSLYRERNRPQLHFSTRRGWINDPNGLVFYDGEYHLFYQHNPYGTGWGNMHWGHAVSKDLVHWQELPIALYPDNLGTMFSGSAVIDYNNTAGFNRSKTPAMVAIYTANNGYREVQCVAYSLDKGRTWAKYAGNPVIDTDTQFNDTRDPKVFWYAPGKHWVMILYEKDGHSIYTSDDLKKWTYRSHTAGFYECPELFELPVDGDPKNTKWVMYGGAGTYMTGNFDGKQFTPDGGKYQYCFGGQYAAQTFSNIPVADGRRIQIGWGRISQPADMPFNQLMLSPTELTLRTTKAGIRMFSTPVKEIESLNERTFSWNTLTMKEANEKLQMFDGKDLLRIKCNFVLDRARDIAFESAGQQLIRYEIGYSRVNGVFYSPENRSGMEITADIIIDKTSVEVFIDGGALSYSMERKPSDRKKGIQFTGSIKEIRNLTVCEMKSIYPAQ